MQGCDDVWRAECCQAYKKYLEDACSLLVTVMSGLRRRTLLSRLFFFGAVVFFVRILFFPSTTSKLPKANDHQIKEHNFIERATGPDRSLNVQRHSFLQARMGRDEGEDIFSGLVRNGMRDYWERFQMP